MAEPDIYTAWHADSWNSWFGVCYHEPPSRSASYSSPTSVAPPTASLNCVARRIVFFGYILELLDSVVEGPKQPNILSVIVIS